MKRRFDVFLVVVLLLILVIANFIGNDFVKGILLLIFSLCLIWNTIAKLREKRKEKLSSQILYALLLLFNIILAIGAIAVIVLAAIEN